VAMVVVVVVVVMVVVQTEQSFHRWMVAG
jgi:hypothetical protein